MIPPARLLLLGSALLLAATFGSGCDRVRSLTKNLKSSSNPKPAVTASFNAEQITTIDASSYDAFIAQKNKLVIVDFYADWCGPCRRLGPMLEAAAAAHPAVVFIGRVNVDHARPSPPSNKSVASPDVRIFKDGREVDRFVGCPSEPELVDKIATLAQGITPAAAAPTAPAKPLEESVTPMPKDWLPPGIHKR